MLKQSLQEKLMTLVQRYEEIQRLLSEPEVMSNQNKFRDLSKEYSQLESLVLCYQKYQKNTEELNDSKQMIEEESDPEMREMAAADSKSLTESLELLAQELKTLLIPKDPKDDLNIYLEIRAGTGGNEASLFVGDLFRMYSKFADQKKWKIEVMSSSEGEQGGYKEIITRIIGDSVYSQLKFESGAHRVQRVPATESQGRIHTSACTVAVMPEVESIEEIDINPNDIRIDTFRSSGAGGQHVNTTDSAIRITHLPTGIVVECQDERSQHKNKAKALAHLSSRILSHQQDAQNKEQAEARKSLVGSGDRSERIRTYNFPQGRVTDHRINLTLYKLDDIMEGNMSDVIDPLTRELQAELLADFD